MLKHMQGGDKFCLLMAYFLAGKIQLKDCQCGGKTQIIHLSEDDGDLYVAQG